MNTKRFGLIHARRTRRNEKRQNSAHGTPATIERECPCHVIAATEAPKAAALGEEVPVVPAGGDPVSATALNEAGGNRRWVVNGEPEEDWWVEVGRNGQRLPGEWEYDREEGIVVCSIG